MKRRDPGVPAAAAVLRWASLGLLLGVLAGCPDTLNTAWKLPNSTHSVRTIPTATPRLAATPLRTPIPRATAPRPATSKAPVVTSTTQPVTVSTASPTGTRSIGPTTAPTAAPTAAPTQAPGVSFTRDVATLIGPRCAACHAPGGIASRNVVLTDASGNADETAVAENIDIIISDVQAGRMPQGGPRFTADEVAVLQQWKAAGTPAN